MLAVIRDRLKFVQFVFAEPLSAQSLRAETKAYQNEQRESDKQQCSAGGKDASFGKQLRPETRGDDGIRSYRQS